MSETTKTKTLVGRSSDDTNLMSIGKEESLSHDDNKDKDRGKDNESSKNTETRKRKEKDDKDKVESTIKYAIYKYSKSGPLSEAILINGIPHFLQIVEGEPKLLPSIPLSDTALLCPPSDFTNYLSKEYSFSSIDEIKVYIKRAKNKQFNHCITRLKVSGKNIMIMMMRH